MFYTLLFKFSTRDILWWDRWLTYVIFAGVFLAVVLATWTGAVAARKGRRSWLWFLLGFFLPFIALIIIYVLPAPAGGKVSISDAEAELDEDPGLQNEAPAGKKDEPGKKHGAKKEEMEEEQVEKHEPERINLHVLCGPGEFARAADDFFREKGWTASSRAEGRVTYEKKTDSLTELNAFKYEADDDRTRVTWSYVRGYVSDETLLSVRDFLKLLKG